MSLPKLLAYLALFLFGTITVIALFKKSFSGRSDTIALEPSVVEIAFSSDSEPAALNEREDSLSVPPPILPEANVVEGFFNKGDEKLPFVETVTYKSHVSWQKGRPAWLSDYAAHYRTSRHFIARSLNGRPEYNKQEVAEGDKFNVLRNDKNFQFHLVVDTSRCKMWFYTLDLDEKKATLIKTYQVGLGRLDSSKTSGLLTPLGIYTLGDRVAIFKPKMTGNYQGKKTEMISVFGTRWIPFEGEVSRCTAPAKGFGIHGTPWVLNSEGALSDRGEGIGKYESDGCIRLATADIEELFSIIISRPTQIEIVRDFRDSSLYHKND